MKRESKDKKKHRKDKREKQKIKRRKNKQVENVGVSLLHVAQDEAYSN